MSTAIQQVVAQIVELRHEMHQNFSQIEGRLSAVETALGMRKQVRGEVRNRFFDYTFKSGWLLVIAIVSSVVSYLLMHIHHFIQ